MFKICVIGCGGMSASGHGPSFAKYKRDYADVVLAGCCDLNVQKAQIRIPISLRAFSEKEIHPNVIMPCLYR